MEFSTTILSKLNEARQSFALMMVFGSSKTSPIDDPKILKEAQEIAQHIGIAPPNLYRIESRKPQAGAGISGDLFISSKLMDYPSDERRVILAHEMGHLKDLVHKVLIRAGQKDDSLQQERDADKAAVCATSPENFEKAFLHLKKDMMAFNASQSSLMVAARNTLGELAYPHDSIEQRIKNAKTITPTDCARSR